LLLHNVGIATNFHTIMHTKIITLLAATLAMSASAQEFDAVDKALYAAAQGAAIVDWSQTRSFIKQPDKFAEGNPLLGRNPSRDKVDAFMVARLGVQHLVFTSVPAAYRKPVMAAVSITSWAAVASNHRIGVSADGFGGEDKLAHFAVSAAAGAATRAYFGDRLTDTQAVAVALIPGTIKEALDASSKGGSGWSNRDMLANVLGAVAGVKLAGWGVSKRGQALQVTYSTQF
jgi:uncharacterized protein YfiM (DUF2279 family)